MALPIPKMVETAAPSGAEWVMRNFEKLRQEMETESPQDFISLLLLAQKGDGKTRFLTTARKPIYVCSFDPKGSWSVREEIESGDIYVETKYEKEDLRRPTAFNEWQRDFEGLCKSKADNELGTYCIDSGYLWMESQFALLDSRFTGKDRRQLYGEFLSSNLYWTRRLMNLNCNVIFTCHIDRYTDPISGEKETTLLAPGMASKEKVPVPFPEMWILANENGKREIIVEKEAKYKGCTRIGRKGRLEGRQPADFCAILRKCGLPTEPRGETNE